MMRLVTTQLPYRLECGVVVPQFLDDVDHPWLQRLIERVASSDGLRVGDIEAHLCAPLAIAAPPAKQKLAAFMLTRSLGARVDAAAPPKEVRERTWIEAARERDKTVALARSAAAFGITSEQAMAALFADLPVERVIVLPRELSSPSALASRANLWIAQSLVSRATRLSLDVKGAARGLLHNAKSRGLLCTVTGDHDGSGASLDLSGPLSLFKRTRLYGRALAALVPSLAWCDRWVLNAEVVVAGRSLAFRLSTGAPILPADPPKRFDSRAETRFALDFEKLRAREPALAGPWQLVREPRPIIAGKALLFPDFALERGVGTPAARTVYVELVGFWTPQYLAEKLARYRHAPIPELVLCVDDDLACTEGDMPEHAHVVRFKKRVDVGALLVALNQR